MAPRTCLCMRPPSRRQASVRSTRATRSASFLKTTGGVAANKPDKSKRPKLLQQGGESASGEGALSWHIRRNRMAKHKYKVGQRVRFRPTHISGLVGAQD